MTEFDPSTALRQSNAEQLSKMIELDAPGPEMWADQDLPVILRHQLAAPLEFDLNTLELAGRAAQNREQTLTGATSSGIRSFGDLLFHHAPPLELLKLSKRFFKERTQACRKNSPEWKLAYLLYLLTLLVAGDRVSRLSSLSPKDFLKGANWALEQAWLDQKTRQLILAARKRLLT
jgi:hypothetical protein